MVLPLDEEGPVQQHLPEPLGFVVDIPQDERLEDANQQTRRFKGILRMLEIVGRAFFGVILTTVSIFCIEVKICLLSAGTQALGTRTILAFSASAGVASYSFTTAFRHQPFRTLLCGSFALCLPVLVDVLKFWIDPTSGVYLLLSVLAYTISAVLVVFVARAFRR